MLNNHPIAHNLITKAVLPFVLTLLLGSVFSCKKENIKDNDEPIANDTIPVVDTLQPPILTDTSLHNLVGSYIGVYRFSTVEIDSNGGHWVNYPHIDTLIVAIDTEVDSSIVVHFISKSNERFRMKHYGTGYGFSNNYHNYYGYRAASFNNDTIGVTGSLSMVQSFTFSGTKQ